MIMEGGFGSPRAEKFPAGLRVLVVDDDPTWLKILEKMLKKCSYQVTTCGLAIDALTMLRENKNSFDIVISDVNMPDMDGFKLLEQVGLEMDLPVIMMSVDGETSRVMKGVRHGACDYLLKPIRMKELSNIWQHVYRKKMHEVNDVADGYGEAVASLPLMKNETDKCFDGQHQPNGCCSGGVKKRKDADRKRHGDQELTDPSCSKKSRVVWSMELHQKFLEAVNQIGYDKLGPKKILDKMNVPNLTRDNVASHLQKYRLYLAKMQNDNEHKTSSGVTKQQVFSPGDSVGSFDFANVYPLEQKNMATGFGYTTSKMLLDELSMGFLDVDTEGTMVSFSPAGNPKTPWKDDLPNHHKAIFGPQVRPLQPFNAVDPSHKYQQFEPALHLNPWDKTNQQPNQQIISRLTTENNYWFRPNLPAAQPPLQDTFQSAFNLSTNPSFLMSADRQFPASEGFRSPPTVIPDLKFPSVIQNYHEKLNYATEQKASAVEPPLSSCLNEMENDTLESCFFQGLGGSGLTKDLMDELGGALCYK